MFVQFLVEGSHSLHKLVFTESMVWETRQLYLVVSTAQTPFAIIYCLMSQGCKLALI